jgi:hypothetical protein
MVKFHTTTKSLTLLVAILCFTLIMASGGNVKSECGDLNNDGNIDFDDYTYLTNYMFHDGPAPIGDADMDECGSINMGDAWYLIQHLWVAGDPPCQGSVTCNSPTGGNVIYLDCPYTILESTVDSVPIPIYMTNTDTIRSVSLGFVHNSPVIEITSVSFIGSMTSAEVGRGFSVDTSINEVEIYWNSAYDQIRPQAGGLFATMWAQVPNDIYNHIVDIDTTFISPATEVVLCPVNGGVLTPVYNDCGTKDIIVLVTEPVCGDVNEDAMVNILDISHLIAYLYMGGPEPVCR